MTRPSIALLMFSCFVPVQAQAEPIEIGRHLVGSDQVTSEQAVEPGSTGRFFWGFPQAGADLFGVELTADDVGRTFRVTAQTDPNFAAAAAMITNGVNDLIHFSLRFADGQWGGHSDFEAAPSVVPLWPGPGDIVSAISFRLDGFSLVDGPSFRSVQYFGVVSIEGTPAGGVPDPIPEPGTFILLGTGLAAGLFGVRRRGSGTA